MRIKPEKMLVKYSTEEVITANDQNLKFHWARKAYYPLLVFWKFPNSLPLCIKKTRGPFLKRHYNLSGCKAIFNDLYLKKKAMYLILHGSYSVIVVLSKIV